MLSPTRYTRRTTRGVRPHRSSRLQRECSPAPTEGEEPPAAAIDSVCTNLPPLSLDIHPSPSALLKHRGDVSATQAVRAERPWFLRAVLQCVHRRVTVTCGRGCRRRARRPAPARVRPAHAPHPPFSGAPASVRQSTMLPAPWVWEPVSLNQCAWREIRRRRAQACPRDVTSNPPSIVSGVHARGGWGQLQPQSPRPPGLPNPELWQPSPLRWAYSAVLAVRVAPSQVSGLWLTPVLC